MHGLPALQCSTVYTGLSDLPEAGEQQAVGLDPVLQAVQLPAGVALLQYLIQYIQYI